jgi:hypothetical protein
MADSKEDIVNIPQEFSTALIDQNTRDLLAKSTFYRQVFGDEFVSNGFQQLGSQFFTLLDAQLSKNPDILANISATSGMYKPFDNGLEVKTQGLANARLGAEANNFRAGVSVPFVQGQDMTYRRMPAMYDVGYNTGLFGGNLDISGGIVPKEGNMPNTMYNIMARYTKKF